ncbi:transketolase [Pseudonocardia acaciae]|uniref:transketolase n=1 Tax=Pseudonocardia acaciae TaxID=551276 RepID=UPI001FE01E13|nr:transketolase [Pseudonocardia acaciae]
MAYGYADLPALMARLTGDEKHSVAATSTMDVLWVLYDRVLDLRPGNAADPDRDRFLLSKGHGAMAFYATLVVKGFLDEGALDDWGAFGSPLGMHPDRVVLPGAEISSGSLGHGLPLALGIALGWRAQRRTAPRLVVLVGDAELDEGSNAEAIQLAGRLGLEQLTAVVVDNASSSHGWPGGIERRFELEGWTGRAVDGRDHEALYGAFTDPHPGRPLAVVAQVEPNGG